MSDKEVALRLVEKRGIASNENYVGIYLKILEDLQNHKSKTILGKLEDILFEYDNGYNYSEYAKGQFIEKIRKLVEENK